MKFERIRSPEVPELEPGSLSNCKKVGNQVFVSGLLSWDENMDVLHPNDAYLQSKKIFGDMKTLMEAAGGKIDDVAKITVFVTDMRHQPDVWKARREVFSGDFPCSTLVCVSHLFKTDALVEIEAIGVIGASPD